MVGRSFYIACALAVSARVTGTPASTFTHPGTIVDAATGKGIEAKATAYASEAMDAQGPCPQHKDELHSTRSDDTTGNFGFLIPVDHRSYVAVYCKGDYYYRTETGNQNAEDRAHVLPDPVELLPSRVPKSPNEQSVRMAAAIERQLVRFRSNLKYFARSDAVTARAVLEKLPADQRGAVLVLGGDDLRRALNSGAQRPR